MSGQVGRACVQSMLAPGALTPLYAAYAVLGSARNINTQLLLLPLHSTVATHTLTQALTRS